MSRDVAGQGLDMVRWYIFDIGTIMTSLRINEFSSLHGVGRTYMAVVTWCEQLVELSQLISSAQQFAFQSCNFFFFREGEYCCLAVCPVIRHSSFCLVTVVISVRLEWNFCARVFRHNHLDCFFSFTSATFSIKETKNIIVGQHHLYQNREATWNKKMYVFLCGVLGIEFVCFSQYNWSVLDTHSACTIKWQCLQRLWLCFV